jgi:hypothetical protein
MESVTVPKVKDEKEEIKKTLLNMREKLLSGISEKPIPEVSEYLPVYLPAHGGHS